MHACTACACVLGLSPDSHAALYVRRQASVTSALYSSEPLAHLKRLGDPSGLHEHVCAHTKLALLLTVHKQLGNSAEAHTECAQNDVYIAHARRSIAPLN